jgi:ABC-2 type transport system ATP-binding protein
LTATASLPVLTVAGLGYQYGRRWALRDITFSLPQGDLAILAGRNGAGKSTLLRCLSGWSRPVRGDVEIAGVSVYRSEQAARPLVLLVPDTPPFYDELTAWEHVQLVAQVNRLSGWDEAAQTWLHHFGLWSAREAYPFAFSRGMRYKLALCLALLLEPRLLLLDEPLGPLDPVSAGLLWDELDRRKRAGMAILLSSHQTPPAAPDRYFLLEQAELIADLPGSDPRFANLSLEQVLQRALADYEARGTPGAPGSRG